MTSDGVIIEINDKTGNPDEVAEWKKQFEIVAKKVQLSHSRRFAAANRKNKNNGEEKKPDSSDSDIAVADDYYSIDDPCDELFRVLHITGKFDENKFVDLSRKFKYLLECLSLMKPIKNMEIVIYTQDRKKGRLTITIESL